MPVPVDPFMAEPPRAVPVQMPMVVSGRSVHPMLMPVTLVNPART